MSNVPESVRMLDRDLRSIFGVRLKSFVAYGLRRRGRTASHDAHGAGHDGEPVVHTMAVEYPGLARLAMTHIPIGDNSLRIAESVLSLLKAGGIDDQSAAYAMDLISSYINAIAYEQSLYATLYSDPQHEEQEVARIAERFENLSAERYQTIAALARQMTAGDGEERFALGLDVIVNGLIATPTEDSARP